MRDHKSTIIDSDAGEVSMQAAIASLVRALPDAALVAVARPYLAARLGLDLGDGARAVGKAPRARRAVRAPVEAVVTRPAEDEDPGDPVDDIGAEDDPLAAFDDDPIDDVGAEDDLRAAFDEDPADDVGAEDDPLADYDEDPANDQGAEDDPRELAAAVRPQLRVVPAPASRRLPVLQAHVPIDNIRAPSDRFRCAPFSAVITATTCIDRQIAARANPIGRTSRAVEARALASKLVRCKACVDGERVHARVEASQPRKAAGGVS